MMGPLVVKGLIKSSIISQSSSTVTLVENYKILTIVKKFVRLKRLVSVSNFLYAFVEC